METSSVGICGDCVVCSLDVAAGTADQDQNHKKVQCSKAVDEVELFLNPDTQVQSKKLSTLGKSMSKLAKVPIFIFPSYK